MSVNSTSLGLVCSDPAAAFPLWLLPSDCSASGGETCPWPWACMPCLARSLHVFTGHSCPWLGEARALRWPSDLPLGLSWIWVCVVPGEAPGLLSPRPHLTLWLISLHCLPWKPLCTAPGSSCLGSDDPGNCRHPEGFQTVPSRPGPVLKVSPAG